jgi:hypothetical protein
MPTGLNAPIQAEDITSEKEFVRLHRDKFAALLNYNEHIEHSLTFVEFDHQRERNFSKLLLCALAVVCEAVAEYSHTLINDEEDSSFDTLKQSLEAELKTCHRAFSEGAINDDQKNKLDSILVEVLRKVEANRGESRSAEGGSDE